MYQTRTVILKDTEFILITGRHCDQKAVICYMLKLKGFKIAQAYFNQMERRTVIDENSFLLKYWTAKVKLINQLRLSNEYKSIKVIEDDSIICSMLEKLNFEVYKAQIQEDYSITFTPPQKRLMTDLQTILTPR